MVKKLSIKPLGDKIVIELTKESEKTKSGIILPETVDKEKPGEGVIVAVGDGDRLKKYSLKIGDKVLFTKYGGVDFKFDNVEYRVLSLSSDPKDDEVLAVLK